MISLQQIVTELDHDQDSHLARILILLSAFDHPDVPALDGITKLAKLDFLLRYPSFFERAMRERGVQDDRAKIETYERNSVEAQMVRYRFGPWDHKYRRFLNILTGMGLVRILRQGRATTISLTGKGRELATRLSEQAVFQTTKARAQLLKSKLDLTPTHITKFIYETFPEVVSLSSNKPI